MRFLVAGCGSIGMRHLAVLRQRDDVAIAATDVNPAAAAKVAAIDPAIPFFPAVGQALDWAPDILIDATPNQCHADTTIAALNAGAHVLCEKPIADTVANARRMVDTAQRNGKVLAVGYSERFRPAVEFLLDMVSRGEFGTLIGGRAMVGTYNTLLCAKSDYRSRIFGILITDYTHELDLLHAIFGEVRELTCRANSLAARELTATPSLAAMLIEYESGALVSVHLDYVQHPQRRCLEIYGDRKVAEFDMQTDQVRLFDCSESGYRTLPFDPIRNERFAAEHQDMIDAVRSGARPRVTGAEALQVLEVAERAINQLR